MAKTLVNVYALIAGTLMVLVDKLTEWQTKYVDENDAAEPFFIGLIAGMLYVWLLR